MRKKTKLQWAIWMGRKAYRKREWWVWWEYEGIAFGSRNAALMWLKRYARENFSYMLKDKWVRVVNGYVYFYNPDCGLMISAEPKRMCAYGRRNN